MNTLEQQCEQIRKDNATYSLPRIDALLAYIDELRAELGRIKRSREQEEAYDHMCHELQQARAEIAELRRPSDAVRRAAMAEHMQKLIEMGSTGLDLSPGDATAKWAVDTIGELRARIAQLELSVDHYKELATRWENEAKKDLADNQRLEQSVRQAHLIAQLEAALNTNRNARNVLYAENQRLRADAERMDWLESDRRREQRQLIFAPDGALRLRGEEPVVYYTNIRSAIDAARGAK